MLRISRQEIMSYINYNLPLPDVPSVGDSLRRGGFYTFKFGPAPSYVVHGAVSGSSEFEQIRLSDLSESAAASTRLVLTEKSLNWDRW